jgi:C4-dicarboxylate transporter DctQ subunit
MAALVRLFDRILLAGGILSGCVLIIIMLMVTVKVIFRYVLNEGLIGVDLLSGTLLVYMTFLGAAWVLKHEQHVVLFTRCWDLLCGSCVRDMGIH